MRYTLLSFIFAVFCVKVLAQVQHDTTIKEDNGFTWIITEMFDGNDFKRGAKTIKGIQLIPCEYSWIYYNDNYFYAIKEDNGSSIKALYSTDGKCIIPIDNTANEITVIKQDGVSPYILFERDKKHGIYSMSGTELVEAKYDNIFMHDDKYYTKNKRGEITLVDIKDKKDIDIDRGIDDFYSWFAHGLANAAGMNNNDKKESVQDKTSNDNTKPIDKSSSTNTTIANANKSKPVDNTMTCSSCGGSGNKTYYDAFLGVVFGRCNVCFGTGKVKLFYDPVDGNYYPGSHWNSGAVTGSGTSTNTTATSGGNSSLNTNSASYNRMCNLCAGSGQCKTCMGKGFYYSSFGSGKLSCPNCDRNNNGRCSSCHGTGRQ